jgi:hypothetical protein
MAAWAAISGYCAEISGCHPQEKNQPTNGPGSAI